MTGPAPTGHSTNLSTLAVVGGVVAVVGILAAVALFLTGDDALQRLGIVAAATGLAVPGLLALVRADQAVTQTNGINAALVQANAHLAAAAAQPIPQAVLEAAVRTAVTAATVVPAITAPPAVAPVPPVVVDVTSGLG